MLLDIRRPTRAVGMFISSSCVACVDRKIFVTLDEMFDHACKVHQDQDCQQAKTHEILYPHQDNATDNMCIRP
jgi:hypothetical protein